MLYFNSQTYIQFLRILPLLLFLVIISGCGFTPIYKEITGDGIQKQFNFVTINTISGVPGFHLRNYLVNRMQPKGVTVQARYRLSIQLSSRTEPLLIQLDNTATRKNIKMVAIFTLTDISKNSSLFSNSVSSVGSFNVVDSDFATITAEKNTIKRVSKEVANRIYESLAVYFSQKVS